MMQELNVLIVGAGKSLFVSQSLAMLMMMRDLWPSPWTGIEKGQHSSPDVIDSFKCNIESLQAGIKYTIFERDWEVTYYNKTRDWGQERHQNVKTSLSDSSRDVFTLEQRLSLPGYP